MNVLNNSFENRFFLQLFRSLLNILKFNDNLRYLILVYMNAIDLKDMGDHSSSQLYVNFDHLISVKDLVRLKCMKTSEDIISHYFSMKYLLFSYYC